MQLIVIVISGLAICILQLMSIAFISRALLSASDVVPQVRPGTKRAGRSKMEGQKEGQPTGFVGQLAATWCL